MIIRILKRMKKDIKTIKIWLEIKNAVSQINNTLKGINSRLDEAEDCISDFKDKVEKRHPNRAAKRRKTFLKMKRD